MREVHHHVQVQSILVVALQASFDRRRRSSLRQPNSLHRGSIVTPISSEVPWDIFDRLFGELLKVTHKCPNDCYFFAVTFDLVPILYCHALALICSNTLSFFNARFAFSTFGFFFVFAFATCIIVLFYHNLKVSTRELFCVYVRKNSIEIVNWSRIHVVVFIFA